MATKIKHLKVGGTTYDLAATTADSMGEANLTWGGKNFAGSFGPIDAAMIPRLGANRFAFAEPGGITVEYSTNGGSTWTDYGATDKQKLALTSTGNVDLTVGKRTAAGTCTINDQLRITIDTHLCGIYSELNKFCIYLSTEGCRGCTCTIDVATHAAPTNFSTITTANLLGWSGYNIINTSNITTYGNSDYQYQKLRFTFKISSVNTSYKGLTIFSIFAFGGVGWSAPSTLSKTGNIYTYDEYKNVTFPKNVAAESFSGNGYQLTALNATNITQGTLSADRLATSGVTSGSYGPTANVTGTNGTTINVPQITVDSKGRVTSVVNRTYTSKDTNSTYTIATSTTAGLVKPVSVITKPTINGTTTTSGRYYSVQMSSDGAMFVNVPWSAGSDTHYLAYNYIGAADASTNGSTTNGNTYLKLYENGNKRSQFKISGSGATSVTSDSNGNITIYSSNTDSKTSSSNTTSKIYLVGPTSQSSSGQTTYSNSSCYASGGYLYSNGKKVDMDSISGGVEWGTF